MLTARIASALRARAARSRSSLLSAAGGHSLVAAAASLQPAVSVASICTASAAVAAAQRYNLQRAQGLRWQLQFPSSSLQHRSFASAAGGAKGDAGAGADAGRKFGGEGSGEQEEEGQEQQQQQDGQQQEQGESIVPEGVSALQVGVGVALILGITIGGTMFFWALKQAAPTEEEIAWAQERGQEASWYTNVKDMFLGTQPLLPREQVDALGRRPRTVVIGWDKVIVKCDWNRAEGWKVRKRPGVDRFLERAQRAGYEVILWANMPQFEIEGLVAELDRTAAIKHKLFTDNQSFKHVVKKDEKQIEKELAEANAIPEKLTGTPVLTLVPADPAPSTSTSLVTWMTGGWMQLVRDLARLQRDPRRLLVLDANKDVYAPVTDDTDNVIRIPEYEEQTADKDKTLDDMGDILESIVRYNVSDLAGLVSRYNKLAQAEQSAQLEAAKATAQASLHKTLSEKELATIVTKQREAAQARKSPLVPLLFEKERQKEAAAMQRLAQQKPELARRSGAAGAAALAQEVKRMQQKLSLRDDEEEEDDEDDEDEASKKSWFSRLRDRLPSLKKKAPVAATAQSQQPAL